MNREDKKQHKKSSTEKKSPIEPISQLNTDKKVVKRPLDQKTAYTHKIISLLQQLLKLPEQGDVKIQLIIRNDGSVAKLSIVDAKSKKNKNYIEDNLPLISFPHFGNTFDGDKEHAFSPDFSSVTYGGRTYPRVGEHRYQSINENEKPLGLVYSEHGFILFVYKPGTDPNMDESCLTFSFTLAD